MLRGVLYLKRFMSVKKSPEEWRQILTPEQFRILRENGTEKPFTNDFWKVTDEGEYRCAGCDSLLFTSKEKFISGCGWPAFTEPATKEIVLRTDESFGMERIEVRCGTCDGHLGHVFDDGPKPLGTRYCINSASLNLIKKDDDDKNKINK
jgi:peptide-methionine (R)-S-oxide reductase